MRESKKPRRRLTPIIEEKRQRLPLWTRGTAYVVISVSAIYGVVCNLRLLASEFHVKQANLLLEAGRLPEARYEYEKAVSQNPYSVTAYYKLGHAYASLVDSQRALKSYLEVTRLSGSYARVHYNLGAVYASLGDLRAARKEFQLATRLDDLPSSWLQFGLVEAKLGNLEAGREAISKALKQDPTLDGADPHFELGKAYQDAGQRVAAEEEYKRALAFTPNDNKLHTNLGTLYFDAGRHREAIGEYQEAIRLNPQDAFAYANLASVYVKEGKTGAALEMWRKVAVCASPDSELGKRAREMLSTKGGERPGGGSAGSGW